MLCTTRPYRFLLRALKRAIAAIFSRQTPEEQRRGITIFQNDRGLNAADVFVFGPMAKLVLSDVGLSERDLAVCRALLPSGIPWLGKYRTQLAEMFQDELLPDPGDNNDSVRGGVKKGVVQ